MKLAPRLSAAAIVLIAFAILAALYLTGCATRPTGRETAALTSSIANAEAANTAARGDLVVIRSNLSRADGKATVILRWLEQHRGEGPQH